MSCRLPPKSLTYLARVDMLPENPCKVKGRGKGSEESLTSWKKPCMASPSLESAKVTKGVKRSQILAGFRLLVGGLREF